MKTTFRVISVFTISLIFFAGDCQKDQRVRRAEEIRNDALQTYARNDGKIDDFVLEKLRAVHYRFVDYKADRDREAVAIRDAQFIQKSKKDGTLTSENAAEFMIELMQASNKKKEEIENVKIAKHVEIDRMISRLKRVRRKNELNNTIALKLNELVNKYEGTELDESMVDKGIDAILEVLAQFNIIDPEKETRNE